MKVTWPHVAIVLIVLTTITILALSGQDTSAILSLATLLFIGIGLIVGQQQAQRDQTNGNTSEMLKILEGLAKQLGETIPPKVIEGSTVVIKDESEEK